MPLRRPAGAILAFMITSWTSLSISIESDVLALDHNLSAGKFFIGLIDITFLSWTLLQHNSRFSDIGEIKW